MNDEAVRLWLTWGMVLSPGFLLVLVDDLCKARG